MGRFHKIGKVLSTEGRKKIKEGNFALSGRRYPIHDSSHARNALSRVSQHGTPEEKAKVVATVRNRYPGIGDGLTKSASVKAKKLLETIKNLPPREKLLALAGIIAPGGIPLTAGWQALKSVKKHGLPGSAQRRTSLLIDKYQKRLSLSKTSSLSKEVLLYMCDELEKIAIKQISQKASTNSTLNTNVSEVGGAAGAVFSGKRAVPVKAPKAPNNMKNIAGPKGAPTGVKAVEPLDRETKKIPGIDAPKAGDADKKPITPAASQKTVGAPEVKLKKTKVPNPKSPKIPSFKPPEVPKVPGLKSSGTNPTGGMPVVKQPLAGVLLEQMAVPPLPL